MESAFVFVYLTNCMAKTRYTPGTAESFAPSPAAALRAVLREGYSLADLRADVLAGLVVGIVALPLSMALAIAVGRQNPGRAHWLVSILSAAGVSVAWIDDVSAKH